MTTRAPAVLTIRWNEIIIVCNTFHLLLYFLWWSMKDTYEKKTKIEGSTFWLAIRNLFSFICSRLFVLVYLFLFICSCLSAKPEVVEPQRNPVGWDPEEKECQSTMLLTCTGTGSANDYFLKSINNQSTNWSLKQ